MPAMLSDPPAPTNRRYPTALVAIRPGRSAMSSNRNQRSCLCQRRGSAGVFLSDEPLAPIGLGLLRSGLTPETAAPAGRFVAKNG